MGNAILLMKASETQTRHCVAVKLSVVRQTPHLLLGFFFLFFFVVKGRPASDNVLRFPLALKKSRRDKYRKRSREKKNTYCFVNLFFCFLFVLFDTFCCSNGNLKLEKERTLWRQLRYSSRRQFTQRVQTEFLRQFSTLTASSGWTNKFSWHLSVCLPLKIQDNIYSRSLNSGCLGFKLGPRCIVRCQCGCAFRRRSALCCCFLTRNWVSNELWIFFHAFQLFYSCLCVITSWNLSSRSNGFWVLLSL